MLTPSRKKFVKIMFAWIMFLILAILFILDLSYTPEQKFGRCRIVGDHEFVTAHCVPYCPPRPSECG